MSDEKTAGRPSKASPARLAALAVGGDVRRRDAYAQDVIARRSPRASRWG